MKIGFIGAGNMGSAMIEGYVRAVKRRSSAGADLCSDVPAGVPGVLPEVFVFDPDEARTRALREKHGVNICKSSKEAAQKSDLIILAVKPYISETVMKEIKDSLDGEKIIISIALGVTLEQMESVLGRPRKIVRTMPNMPCMAGEGMIAVSPNADVTQEDMQTVVGMLSCSGTCEIVPESMMDAVAGVSGSSPAYVYIFIEALADGAVAQGMPRRQAYRFAARAVLGGAKMVLQTGKHPGELKDEVCSPGGSTIEAVRSLEQNNFRFAVTEAVRAASEKSREAGRK